MSTHDQWNALGQALAPLAEHLAIETVSDVLPDATLIELHGEFNEDWLRTLRIRRVLSATGAGQAEQEIEVFVVHLIAEVERGTGEVISVHLADEQIEGPLAVTDWDGSEAKPKKRRKAIEIAETQRWPGWVAGW